ncbi:MAG TPA: serine hydrolase [Pirellulales bacterium]|jgi:CubicO group peptidase (beta-lactamase class C family)|nr:serine hydrolase [Pirellulales bacterium]
MTAGARIVALARVLAAFGLLSMPATRPTRAEPDEAKLGKAEGYPRGTAATMYAERFRVGSFSAADQILPSRSVARGGTASPLEHGPEREIVYRFDDASRTIDDYLDRQRVTALLVLKDGKIVAQRFRYGRGEHDRFLSFSMSKSINSLLLGIALDKGLIASLDDPAEKYVAGLRDSGYGQSTLRQLLRMSSGVQFVEEYTGRDDIARLRRAQLGQTAESALECLASFNERRFPAGERLGYASSETTVLGYVVARATGKQLAELASLGLWQPMGAEADAAWNHGVDGQEFAEGSFNATLRDYGRLGRLLADDGRRGDVQILPRAYLLDATDAARQPEAFRPLAATPYMGYGYQFWLLPMRTRTFALLGIFGQAIYVQPESKIVLVHLAVNAEARDKSANVERDALWRGVLASLGGDVRPPAR